MKMNKALTILLMGTIPTAIAAHAEDSTDNSLKNIEKITVTGNKASDLTTETNSGALGSMSVLNTPFSVATISAEDIEKRQVNSLDTLFSGDASVSTTGGTYSGWGANIAVRGLQLDYTNSYKINGLSVNNFSGELPYEAFQQIELLKGATGFMYGFAAPGGVVNYQTKRPVDNYLSVDAGFRSNAIYSAHVDASTLFGDQDKYGIRVNVAHEEGDTYDGGSIKRNMVSAAFDARLTDSLLWTNDFIYNERTTRGTSSWLIISSDYDTSSKLPSAPNGKTNLGFDGSFNDQKNLIAQSALKWSFSDNWSTKLEYAYTQNDTRWLKSWPYLMNSDGDLEFRYYDQYFDVDYNQWQLSLNGKFSTGFLEHKLFTGVTWQKTTTDRNDPNRDVSWLDGTYSLVSSVRPTYHSSLTEELKPMWSTTQKAFFINDNIGFTDELSLLLGARVNKYDYEVLYSGYKSRINNYSDTEVSPTAALIYKPNLDTTVYASYVESFEEGSLVDEQYANGNEFLPPKESKQYEVGAKIEGDTWSATTALFRIERAATVVTDDNYFLQNGIILYQGWEASGSWLATDELKLKADVMLLNAEYQDTTSSGVAEGNDVAGAPNRQFSLQATYDVAALPGLSLNAGAKYYGKTAVDSANNWELPGYTLFDAAVNYKTDIAGKNVTYSASVSNLTDKSYWASATDGYLRIGEPRVVSLNVKLDF